MSDVPEGAALPSPIHPAVAGVPVAQSGPHYWGAPPRAWIDPYHMAYAQEPEGVDAVAYLRADLALPRPWRTAEELEALPVGSVVLTAAGRVHEKLYDLRWCPTGARWEVPSGVLGVMGPGLILYIPEAP